MRKIFTIILMGGLALAVCSASPVENKRTEPKAVTGENDRLKLETLLSSQLEGVEGIEVIVSQVTIPPHTSLPKHWHPGEEFAYILEGSVVLWQKGKADIVGQKGDVLKVPLKQVHTAITKEEGATILVFRVHEQGKPERIKAD
jgi:quercetin dioxygenase-like cupin family protein